MLRRQGYTYDIVENGQDAVHITSVKEYGLILMVMIAAYIFDKKPNLKSVVYMYFKAPSLQLTTW